MEFKTILVKIDKEVDVTKFDEEINSLVTVGFRLEKRIVVPTEEEVHLVAFLSKKPRYSKKKRYKPKRNDHYEKKGEPENLIEEIEQEKPAKEIVEEIPEEPIQ
ncbi:MAG: hypothetical protein ACXAB7_11435 [Candidatus Kariarchaeaceae archaeon]|jgi:phage gp29-like protein